MNEVGVPGCSYSRKYIHALKYEPGGRVRISFQEAIGRLVSVIKSIGQRKIMIKVNQNEAELLSRFFALATPAFADHPPIQLCPRLRVAKPARR